jgi:geranylgeranyl diphosphate synthase type I
MEICEGQILDVLYPEGTQVSEEDYIYMVGKKTSALFQTCAELGAMIGGGSSDEVQALGMFAWNAGIAFQLIDDYLGITTGEEVLGKPKGSDLREGKKTLIIIHGLENASEFQKEKIYKVLGNKNCTKDEVEKAIKTLKEIGSIDYTKKKAEAYAKKAIRELVNFSETSAKKELIEMVNYFLQRVF